jgi:MFS family permease
LIGHFDSTGFPDGVVFMPAFADILNQGTEGYGFMLSAIGIGALVGSIFVASLGNYKRKGIVLITTGLVFGFFLLLFANYRFYSADYLGLDFNPFYFVAFLLVIMGITASAYTSTSNTIIQMQVSDEYRGRVNAVYSAVMSFYSIAALLAGSIGEILGVPLAITIGGGLFTILM